MIVADTNMLVYLTSSGPNRALARAVSRRDSEWACPPLWRSEFRNAMFGAIRNNVTTPRRALRRFAAAAAVVGPRQLDVETARVIAVAGRVGLSAYDAEFVALSMSLAVPLVTMDRRLLQTVPGTAVHPVDFVSSGTANGH